MIEITRHVDHLDLDDYCQICLRPSHDYTGTTGSICAQCAETERLRANFAAALELLRSTDDVHYRPDVRAFLSQHASPSD